MINPATWRQCGAVVISSDPGADHVFKSWLHQLLIVWLWAPCSLLQFPDSSCLLGLLKVEQVTVGPDMQWASVSVSHYSIKVYTDQCPTLLIRNQKKILLWTVIFLVKKWCYNASVHERGILYHETAFSKVRSVLLSHAINGRSADLTDKPENDDLFSAGKIPVNQKFWRYASCVFSVLSCSLCKCNLGNQLFRFIGS